MTWRMRWCARGAALLLAVVLGCWGSGARAEDYVLGPDDVMQVSVWMHPELERTVTIDAQGNITFPPAGEIKAAGLTPKQLADRVGDRLSAYLRQTTTVTISVTQFMSHSVYVSGAVARPGRIGFEHIPSLLDVISQAGGALPSADLGRVQILRKEGAALRSLPADLTEALQTGSSEGLPALMPGDAVVIPATSAGSVVTADGVAVLGEVNNPGLYSVGAGQDLWMVLGQAGGPTHQGNLGAIRVLTKDQRNVSAAVTVNLKETLQRGNRSPYMVKPGDIVFLSGRGHAWNGFLTLLGVTRDVISVVAVVQALQK